MQTKSQVLNFTSSLIATGVLLTLVGCGGGGANAPQTSTNTAPIASAGNPQSLMVGSTVTLDGSSSTDADHDSLTYNWSLTSKPTGSTANLSSTTAVNPTFHADLPGTYMATLMVNDGQATSSAATVTITAAQNNAAPVANAGGNQNVVANNTVTLDGSASSDANADALTYNWTLTSKPTGSSATLSSPTSARPTFTADFAGTYVASLTVNDGQVNSNVATVTVTAARANAAPVANAGTAQSVVAGTNVTLDGSASSDANGDALTYNWSLTSKPTGSSATLSSATSARPTFTADVAGTYVASLTVNDGQVNSNVVTVSVTAVRANAAPIANAGTAQSVVAGTNVTLDGSASSDANGDALAYNWSLTSKPTGSTATLSSTTSARPTLTADVAGTYVASLTVNDGQVNSSIATVSVTAEAIAFDTLVGTWDNSLFKGTKFLTDTGSITSSITGNTFTIRSAGFFDGTCIYTALLNPGHTSISKGTYQCSDFTNGNWTLQSMKKVDVNDIHINITKNGVSSFWMYGMAGTGNLQPQALITAIQTQVGTYSGISTGTIFPTESADPVTISVSGTNLSISIKRVFSGTCQYSATIQPDGKSITNGTYNCSDFSTGNWSLLDMKNVSVNDLYMSMSVNGFIRRIYVVK
jgi:PKD domain